MTRHTYAVIKHTEMRIEKFSQLVGTGTPTQLSMLSRNFPENESTVLDLNAVLNEHKDRQDEKDAILVVVRSDNELVLVP